MTEEAMRKDLTARLFVQWMMEPVMPGQKKPEFLEYGEEQSFIHKVLAKKMEAFNTGIIVPVQLSLILDIGTESNPGLSQIVLVDIIKHSQIDSLPYTIKSEDFVRVFPFNFPDVDDKAFMDKYQAMWNAQKREVNNSGKSVQQWQSDNLVDTPEYWAEIVKEAQRG